MRYRPVKQLWYDKTIYIYSISPLFEDNWDKTPFVAVKPWKCCVSSVPVTLNISAVVVARFPMEWETLRQRGDLEGAWEANGNLW